MNKPDVFQSRVIAFPPHPVRGQPGVYRVWFLANRGTPDLIERFTDLGLVEGMILVDSAGGGAVIDHQPISPPIAELDPLDFEERALEMVRAMKA